MDVQLVKRLPLVYLSFEYGTKIISFGDTVIFFLAILIFFKEVFILIIYMLYKLFTNIVEI